MYIDTRPFDVIVLKKPKTFNLLSSIVSWRSLSNYTHCVLTYDNKFNIYDADFDGLKKQSLDEYRGRQGTVCRVKKQYHAYQVSDAMQKWLEEAHRRSKGYDYLSMLGFATGIKSFNDKDKYYCSELIYRCFMDHGFQLTNRPLTFVYPSFFVDNAGNFDIVYDGVI